MSVEVLDNHEFYYRLLDYIFDNKAPNPGGHGVYVCLRSFVRLVLGSTKCYHFRILF